MAAKKETEDKLLIKQFKDKSTNYWLAMKHFTVLDGNLVCAAGGEPTDEEITHITKYLKSKKLL